MEERRKNTGSILHKINDYRYAEPISVPEKKKKTKTKKETKRAGEIGLEILRYYILTKRIVKSAKPAYLTLPVVSSYRHVLGIALIKRNVLCNQREIRRIDN